MSDYVGDVNTDGLDADGLDTVGWSDGAVRLIDQTLLPQKLWVLDIERVADLVDAIGRLAVRGAPALGVAGAYGVVLAHDEAGGVGDTFMALVDTIRTARPTAVNLARMVDRVAALVSEGRSAMLDAAHRVKTDEIRAELAMGEKGVRLTTELLGEGPVTAMTVCNTGGLASVRRGTALGVIHTLHDQHRLTEAIAMETRPLLQGGRLTTWELDRMGAPHSLIVDSAGPFLLARHEADIVYVGADRIAANGDTANKIGTFSLALGAQHAGVPFVVVAPESSVDMDTPSGSAITIEDRGSAEIRSVRGAAIAPPDTNTRNPAFDVTPAALITAIVTDRRIVRLDRGETLAETAP